MTPASFLFRYKQETLQISRHNVTAAASRRNLWLVFYLCFVFSPGCCCRAWLPIGSSLDWSWTLVAVRLASTATLQQTHAHSHVTLYHGDGNDADDEEPDGDTLIPAAPPDPKKLPWRLLCTSR